MAKNHHVLRTIEVRASLPECESNKNLPNPSIEGSIEEFAWSETSVENIINAFDNEYIKIEFFNDDTMRIEFLPVNNLPKELGHVTELEIFLKNLKNNKIFGSADDDKLTYLQTVDFAVEGYMDDEREGKEYGRIYIDSGKLAAQRNVYLDPESLHITDYEYGLSYCVKGGMPMNVISRIEVIKAKKFNDSLNSKSSDYLINDKKTAEQHMSAQSERLKKYLKAKLLF
ncbi:MAG: hypothetical protein COU29_03105 [Candidatus Magasanikbacteria bacterium CG10_big_fil_rev_8_21_14_0_10_36_32]|uniref:Uncharacterized protein n=1 Tax=Candidatus Magasanikbacteria bacterium CG10_big_fil_rev_8_21_14_0_10_36_32 TaxID=1974646 RepID=A0A2M6W5Z9_9BACT|nr:MAG: hypothetical protein COU29_03105 [Candidatus Magasanikbacteria bacterium CG10_big_fil_rev_8_21_14_0_10_36_32]